MTFDLDVINALTGGQRLGTFDLPCPECGPYRRSPANRRRPVMRIWRGDPGFATYHCIRCGSRGHVREGAALISSAAIQEARQEAIAREQQQAAGRLRTARYLWSRRSPIEASLAERYLREARGYRWPLPPTLGFLPPKGDHGPAMIAAFGLPSEVEPGELRIDAQQVCGVHVTRLAPDGRGKAGTEHDKIMIGCCLGSPIVLAPFNDGFGLVICEGVEDALSAHESTGLGAWAAGSASRLPALAGAIPNYVEAVSVLVDDDEAGRRFSAELAERLDARGVEVSRTMLPHYIEGIAA